MRNINRIVIMGGGSAGWLTAARLAAKFHHPDNKISVTLVESPEIRTIGVGEGSWPSLRHTLAEIGVSEKAFLKECLASFKQGSKFVAWKDGDLQEHYYHPFTNPQGYTELDLHHHWQTQFSDIPFANAFCPQPAICDKHLGPKQVATPEFAQVANYGYHFDADKLAAFLTRHCVEKLGVKHVRDHIETVTSHDNGDIASLIGQQSGAIEGDLFIDCSGMAARLIKQHYGVQWHSVRDILPNDSAIAVQVPYPDEQSHIASVTIATAKEYGWIWEIGLQHRKGTGLAYSSMHCPVEQAQDCLIEHLKQSGVQEFDSLNLRNIKFEPGYRKTFWQNNCVAIGMSSGFIEPLEASSLAMTELSINMLCDEFPATRDHMAILANRFNQRFKYRWQRVIDFVKLHYILSERQDSEYWLAQKAPESVPESLSTLLELWQHQPPSRLDFIENEEVFSSTSYQYILYGMGFKSASRANQQLVKEQARAMELFQQNQLMQSRFLQGLPDNRQLLNNYYR